MVERHERWPAVVLALGVVAASVLAGQLTARRRLATLEANPAEPNPAEHNPGEPSRLEPKPAGLKPAEPTPAELKPAEPKPAEPDPVKPGRAPEHAPAPVVPGRPRFVVPTGSSLGTVDYSSPAGQGIEEILLLPIGRSVIGRASTCELRLTDTTVSPVHAEVEVSRDGSVLVRDLGADAGVRVDGRPVAEKRLVSGNRVELGAAVLVFRADPLDSDRGREGGEFGEHPIEPE